LGFHLARVTHKTGVNTLWTGISFKFLCLPAACHRFIILFPRFVDRDMVMRFHWGIAIGHLYTHDQNRLPTQTAETNAYSENASAGATVVNTPIANRSVDQSNAFPAASEPDDLLRPPSALQVGDDVPQAEYHPENHQENGWEGELHQDHVVLQAEFGLENRQDNDWEEDNDDEIHGGDDNGWESDDDVFDAMHDMYGQ
jgi:hypothetical protein